MGREIQSLDSLSVPTFQLSSVQAAAVAELLRIAPVADRLGALFSNAGHELYLVGGSVRDALLGKLGHDLDFATSARPDAVEKLLRKFSPAVWTIGCGGISPSMRWQCRFRRSGSLIRMEA